MTPQLTSPLRGASLADGLDVLELLEQMKDHLMADFGFEDVKLAGEAHLNRTTEPVVRFLVWLRRTPEAQAALRLTFQRLASKPRPK